MIRLEGRGIFPGIVIAPVHFVPGQDFSILPEAERECRNAENEAVRFQAALEAVKKDLAGLAEQARGEGRTKAADLFEAYQLILKSREFISEVRKSIEKDGLSAETAVKRSADRLSKRVAGMESAYIKERSKDIGFLSGQILSALADAGRSPLVSQRRPDSERSGKHCEKRYILAVDELDPAALMRLDRDVVLGIYVHQGSTTDHTAVLARILGFPTVAGNGCDSVLKWAERAADGTEAVLDGEEGTLILEPDFLTRMHYLKKQEHQEEQKELLSKWKGRGSKTKDGHSVRISGSIGSIRELEMVCQNSCDGIGLFRTEFMYMECSDFPDEEYQYGKYREILEGLRKNKSRGPAGSGPADRVVFRTLDFDIDKRPAYLSFPEEKNPALGSRGIRFSLEHPGIFRTQLRALYRASAHGKMGLLFPMITSEWEVKEAVKRCEQVKKELEKEGKQYDPDVKIGVMIETPAAALLCGNLAELVDFVSIGTNDLAQYTLAMDRRSNSMERFFIKEHPALLSLIHMAAAQAGEKGIPVGICGELASDENLTEAFLSMGIEEFTVPPLSVLGLRKTIGEITKI